MQTANTDLVIVLMKMHLWQLQVPQGLTVYLITVLLGVFTFGDHRLLILIQIHQPEELLTPQQGKQLITLRASHIAFFSKRNAVKRVNVVESQ